MIAPGEPGEARRVYPVVPGAAGRLGRRVDLGLVGGECGHGAGCEAPGSVSMPLHPTSEPTLVKEARAAAGAVLEREAAVRREREAVEAAIDRALAVTAEDA